jgi:hypothetical protein
MKEYLSEYAKHLRESYADAFPAHLHDPEHFDVKWYETDSYIKIILELPTHTSRGIRIDRKAHSFIAKRLTKFPEGTILKAATWYSPSLNFGRGNITDKQSYQHLSWNRI